MNPLVARLIELDEEEDAHGSRKLLHGSRKRLWGAKDDLQRLPRYDDWVGDWDKRHTRLRMGLAELRVAAQFEELASAWQRETAVESFLPRKTMHWAYQRIIGLGQPAVPLILQRLEAGPDHWYWALSAITGHDPGKATTTIEAARQAWLEWGRQRGYLARHAA